MSDQELQDKLQELNEQAKSLINCGTPVILLTEQYTTVSGNDAQLIVAMTLACVRSEHFRKITKWH
jgi:hypothetical protein